MADVIVIPARYGSTRLPGKPLLPIAGRIMLERVAGVAMLAAKALGDVDVLVATDDARIAAAAEALGLDVAMTSPEISTGSGRALAAIRAADAAPQFIVNLQGDAPFTAPAHVIDILKHAREADAAVTTPVVQLSWPALDALRRHKLAAPASGTTCIRDAAGRAVWFSKAILPFIRNEPKLRQAVPLSPVLQHIGLYCYRRGALEAFEAAAPAPYETLEGLEQLRLIALGIPIDAVPVEAARLQMGGIDSPADLERAERLILEHGDPFVDWRAA
jgi:3-deoxy-manno-octulosonate cytidylyltransferase (CMP-KDO synthetase)